MRTATAAIVALVLGVSIEPARAEWSFDPDEKLHRLVDVALLMKKGQPLVLGFKTTNHNFLLPYALSDDGYVLIVKDSSTLYYPLDLDRVGSWQEAAMLPSPLPAYEVPVFDRILSYSLHFTVAMMALVYALPAIRKRQRRSRPAAD